MTFEARYVGRCSVCDERIEPGDLCAYNSDEFVVHGDCNEAASRANRRPPPPICRKCFMIIPANGECGCDR